MAESLLADSGVFLAALQHALTVPSTDFDNNVQQPKHQKTHQLLIYFLFSVACILLRNAFYRMRNVSNAAPYVAFNTDYLTLTPLLVNKGTYFITALYCHHFGSHDVICHVTIRPTVSSFLSIGGPWTPK